MTHDHAMTTASARHRSKLVGTLALQFSVMLIQVIGAFVSGSMALLADSGHMLTDSAGVAVALGATWLAARPATDRRTFGWQRAEILAALLNAMLLAAVAVSVAIGGISRIINPVTVEPGPMLGFAVVGALANLAGLLMLRGGKDESLNIRGAYLEVLGDMLGSCAVIVAAVVIWLTGFERADGLASLLICVLILPRAFSLFKDVLNVLLESTPPGVDLDVVRTHILGLPKVVAVHDLHAWTITSGVPVLSAHIVVDAGSFAATGTRPVLDHLHECLSEHFDVRHCTFQIEPDDAPVRESRSHP